MQGFVGCVLILFVIPTTILCELAPENIPRPTIKGFSTISGVCDTSTGVISGESYSGRNGTLKACAQKCSGRQNCVGFNFLTDVQQCTLFERQCSQARKLPEPTQNFYLKGEIACSTSTVGQEFYVAFMANRVAQPKNMDLEIWVTQDSSLTPTQVIIQFNDTMKKRWPAAGGNNNNSWRVVQVPYKKAVPIFIPHTWKVNDTDSGVTIEQKALKLSSDTNFVLYGVNKEYFTSDAFLGIPSRALGTRYIVACFWPPYYNCEFAITAATASTHVRITLPKQNATKNDGDWELAPMDSLQGNNKHPLINCLITYKGKRYRNGDSFNLTLNEFDVAQIQEVCDLTGAIIESDKQIAVWSGDSRSNIGFSPNRDHLVEQLFSTDTWGTDCAAWPTPNRTKGHMDYWIITAAVNGTTVKIDSTERPSFSYSLSAGQSVRFPAKSVSEWMRFSTDKSHPFQAVQISHSTMDEKILGDPSMTLCIPSDQFGYGYTFVTPTGVSSNYTNYLTIIATNGTQAGFQLDGKNLAGVKWLKIPNSTLVGGWVRLDTSSKQQFRIEHKTKGTTFEAYIYGAGNRESVAYPTGSCIKALGDCRKSTMFIADGKDNDCDGVIDEELFDGKDNDLDGLIDEDCYAKKSVPAPADRCPMVFAATACYGTKLQMNCSEGTINVVEAHLGRIGRGEESLICDGSASSAVDSCSGSDVACGFKDFSVVASLICNGEQKCSLPVSYLSLGNMIPFEDCPVCSLYAHVQYACLNEREQTSGYLAALSYAASSWLSSYSSDDGSLTCSANSWPPSNSFGDCSACSSMLEKPAEIYEPSQASFTANSVLGWRPAVCDKDSSWLQVDLGGQFGLGWYAISGCRRDDYWITKFSISYSLDGKKWSDVSENDGSVRRFDGNADAINVKLCTLFSYNIVARWVRIKPLAYNGFPCAHVDFGRNVTLQGCSTKAVANSNFALGGTAPFGSTATVICSRGWSTARGDLKYDLRCGSDGRWFGSFNDCNSPLFCPDVPQIKGGYVLTKNNLVGAKVTFGCLEGSRLNGTFSITCQDNGQWSDPAPTCVQSARNADYTDK